MQPNESHGDQSNITLDELREAGEANGQDLDQTIANIERTYHQKVEASSGERSKHEHAY